MVQTSNGDNLKHPQVGSVTLERGVIYKRAAAVQQVAVEMSDYEKKLYTVYRRQGL